MVAHVSSMAQATSEADSTARKVNVAFRTVDERDLLGAVQTVDMVGLTDKKYTSGALDFMQTEVSGYNGWALWNQGGALVLIDGVPRDAGYLTASEIEQVTFLKSAQAIVLYGSRASKGAILITTKRGHTDDLQISARGNATLYTPKRYPKYLGSAAYMQLYNEARQNDGLTPVYSDEDIYHYASGENPYRYPDLNFYSSDYVKKSYQRYDGTVEIQGGGTFAHFYTNINFAHNNDLLNFGEGKDNHTNRLSIRGNVDMKLSDWLTGWVDATAVFNDSRSDLAGFWGAAATQRPTSQYPLVPLIPISYIDPNDVASAILAANSNYVVDGKYILGGTQQQQTNAFAAMYAAGYNKYTNRKIMIDAGINMDLAKVLQGLSFKTHMAIDYQTQYNTSINNQYATYQATWNNYSGADLITTLTKYGTDKHTGTQNASGSSHQQTVFFSGQFDYDRSFGLHNVSGSLLAHAYQVTTTGQYHRTSNANLGLQLDYNYNHTYYADFSMAATHSAKLAPGHRNGLSPVLTLAWRMKNESWLKDVDWLDDLKLTASAGVIREDLDIDGYYYYDNVFTATGQWWGWSEVAQTMQTSLSTRGANEDLTFVKRKEWRAGLEASLFGGDLRLTADYFNVKTNGQLVIPNIVYPSYFSAWSTSFLAYTNFNNQTRQGVDFSIKGHQRLGQVDLSMGLNGMWYKSKNNRISENNEYEWLNATGTEIETLRGYHCLGFYTQEQIDDPTVARINSDTKAGDLRYEDLNKDGSINYQDMRVIGRSTPNFFGGVNFTAKWREWTLYVAGTYQTGGKGLKDNLYEWCYGDRKYSNVVLGRWTPETAATATYPRLTTRSGDLNFVSSDFWMYSTNQFYLSRVQLTYDFPSRLFDGTFVKGLQAYLYGNDLLMIAGERKYMETAVGAGPQCRSYNLGVKVSF